MSPTQVLESARQSYNAVGDTYWSDAELLKYAYYAELELNREGLAIERTFTTNTVVDQREYNYPTNMMQIKRLTYDGAKLKPITFGEWDLLTVNDTSSTETGEPQYYMTWNSVIILQPIPDTVAELKIRGIVRPTLQAITGTFLIDEQFHPAIVDYVVWRMTIKDSNNPMADRYRGIWNEHIAGIRRWRQKKRRGDRFARVKNVDAGSFTYLGGL